MHSSPRINKMMKLRGGERETERERESERGGEMGREYDTHGREQK